MIGMHVLHGVDSRSNLCISIDFALVFMLLAKTTMSDIAYVDRFCYVNLTRMPYDAGARGTIIN